MVVKVLLRWVYQHYGWAAIEGIQWRGSFDDEADARWAANCTGGWYRSLPHNGPLEADVAVQFGVHDFPQSPASNQYRNRRLPYTAIPTRCVDQLTEVIARTEGV